MHFYIGVRMLIEAKKIPEILDALEKVFEAQKNADIIRISKRSAEYFPQKKTN